MNNFAEILNEFTSQPLFGATLTIFTYIAGIKINRALKTPIANPNLIATFIVIAVLLILGIPYDDYIQGGKIIEIFLAPATAALALKIYEQMHLLKKYWLPVLAGTAVGAATSIIVVYAMCKWAGLDQALTASLLPKSVTTAIAIPLSEQNGGIASVTVFCLVVTGIFGAMFSPTLIKLFRIKNPVEAGVAIGTCSHALGTTKAIELGDIEGAMSGCAMAITGLITVLYLMFI